MEAQALAMPSPEKRLETPPQSELGSSASNVPPSLAKRPRDAVDAREANVAAEEPALNGLLALSTACAREKGDLDSENESPHTSNDAFKSSRKKRRVVKAGRSSPVSPDPDSPVQPVQGKATRLPLGAQDSWRDGDKICIKCSAFFPLTSLTRQLLSYYAVS
jgi:hypothetical protein